MNPLTNQKLIVTLICLSAVLSFELFAAQEIQSIKKWVDANGVTHFSNTKPMQYPTATTKATHANAGTKITSKDYASVYKYTDPQGVRHYTDKKPVNVAYTIINTYCPACDPHSSVNWSNTKLNTTAYRAEIDAAAEAFHVDPALVRAIIHAESAFNKNAISKKGAQGLMQLMPTTASMYQVQNAFDANQNIYAGVQHLAGLLEKFNGNESLAAAAYNAGAGAVARYGGIPPYEETRVYVERVDLLRKRYQQELGA